MRNVLWYNSPARALNDYAESYVGRRGWERYSLPIGNGYFGASLFGRLETERIQITENSFCNPRATKEGLKSSAGGLMDFLEIFVEVNHSLASDYVRALDLDEGVSTVEYTHGGVRYKRTYFASYPDKIMAVRFEADKAGAITLEVRTEIPFNRPYLHDEGDGMGRQGEAFAEGDTITVSGKLEYFDLDYEAQIKVIAEGGCTESSDNGRVFVEDADSVTLIVACGTSYEMNESVFLENDPKRKFAGNPHPHERVSGYISEAAGKGYAELLRAHKEDYKRLFSRVSISLGEELPDAPTDELLKRYKAGERSRNIEQLLFQYGRYLLICSSRRGCLPANLQGIWTSYATSPWGAGYWHNINVQMNYWPSGPANLSELFLSYSDYARAYMKRAKVLADAFVLKNYPEKYAGEGNNGWNIGTAAYPYAITGFSGNGHSGPGTGAFTSLLFWDYYDYTGDKEFLRDVAYPALRDMSVFLSKTIKMIDGKMLVEKSASPEQQVEIDGKLVYYATSGCAFDQQMIYENDKRTLEAADILGINEPFLDEIRARLPLLDPVLIGDDGQIKEFREETRYGSIGERDHRHISHLVGLYPGTLINSNNPEWMRGAKITLDGRGNRSKGWAMAHRVCLRARAKCPAELMSAVISLIENNIMDNLWDTHPPFQIDGNFGYTAGVCEALIQSQAGYIEIIPCLPTEWETGSFKGLCARGGYTVDAEWKNGEVIFAKVKASRDGVLKIKLSEKLVPMEAGATDENGIISVQLRAGEEITFSI